MKVFHFGGEINCDKLEELNTVLFYRCEKDCNEFELHVSEEFPFLTILVNGMWSCVHFFENEDDCGHYAYCDENLLDRNGYTIFYTGSSTSETEVSNELVIPFSLALVAAQDFFLFSKKSEKLKWFEL